MSVKRYILWVDEDGYGHISERPEGRYVLHSDYAILETDHAAAMALVLSHEGRIAKLEAERDRLREALEAAIQNIEDRFGAGSKNNLDTELIAHCRAALPPPAQATPCPICNGTWQGCPEIHSKDAVCGECCGYLYDPYPEQCPACHGTRKRAV